MRRKFSLCVVASVVVWGMLLLSTPQDRSILAQEAVKKAAKKAPAAAEKKRITGRLPNYYGQVGLSKDQRTKIYSIQKKFGDQLEALRKQIAELEKQQTQEIEAVLTSEQKTKLTQLIDAAAKKRASRSKKTSVK